MATSVQKNLTASNEKYVSTFDKGDLALPPAKKYLVLTCMDARIDPAAAFGIDLGDAHVIRNVSLNQTRQSENAVATLPFGMHNVFAEYLK